MFRPLFISNTRLGIAAIFSPAILAPKNMGAVLRCLLLFTLITGLTACDGLLSKKPAPPEITKPKPVAKPLSAKPIGRPDKSEIFFAQTALNSLGYPLGRADGIWGPKSARAIRKFEQDFAVITANGRLSELNLAKLETQSGSKRGEVKPTKKPKNIESISSKLDQSVPLESAPQLIFIDRAYSVLAKPNPYSEPLTIARAGAGIYIVAILDGWYEVVAENQITGFIREKQ